MSVIDDSISHILEMENGGVYFLKEPLGYTPLKARLEIRMGHPIEGGGIQSESFKLPGNLEPLASNIVLKDVGNATFWQCAEDLESRFAQTLGRTKKREQYVFFADAKKVEYTEKEKNLEFDLKKLESDLAKASLEINNRIIKDINFDFDASLTKRYYLNSEGTRIFTNFIDYFLSMEITAVDGQKRVIPHSFRWVGNDITKIPSITEIIKKGKQITHELSEILKAPIQNSGAFPAILDGENVGVLFHEVMGHALEAHRMKDDEEWFSEGGVTLFKDRLGEKIAPNFLHVEDNPALENWNGNPLFGHYKFDEEGVAGKKVKLLENGVLKEYMHSRETAGYFKTNSNGHARAELNSDPCPRMSNIIVTSSKTVSKEKLKKELIAECEKKGLKYGLLLVGTEGGLTLPEESHYNTYPKRAFRVYTNGKIQEVRGVFITGEPNQTLMHIDLTDGNYGVFHGFCGAESGKVSGTEIAPGAFVKSLSVSRIPERNYPHTYAPVLK